MVENSEDPEDILESSLTSLYQLPPFALADAGATFKFEKPVSSISTGDPESISVEVLTPDAQAKNWSLHASNIWVSGVFLSKHIEKLGLNAALDAAVNSGRRLEVLELGAGAGLPGIVIAKYLSTCAKLKENRRFRVTLSDYPDENIIETLRFNVSSNNLQEGTCRVIPHAWGEDVSSILSRTSDSQNGSDSEGYDLIVAADTLWNVATHDLLIKSLSQLLRRTNDARIHLVAGLHTGRYSIQGFFKSLRSDTNEGTKSIPSLCVEKAQEYEVKPDAESQSNIVSREWSPDRSDSSPNDIDRRRWIVWIVLRWSDFQT